MKKTGFLFDERYLLHRTGRYHPEVPERLKAIYKGIEEGGLLSRVTMISASFPEIKWIEMVHDRGYISRLEKACRSDETIFDSPDNQMCADTYETALLAVGGLLETVRMVMEGTLDNAFCAVRPPGHHAETNRAMGFCYFNNVAIAARYLQNQWAVERIGIVDFDVHHGNGTQQIFENDPSVLFVSSHQMPLYPGSGHPDETGVGNVFNLPLAPGSDSAAFRASWSRRGLPAVADFAPDFILVSAGFDAHERDPLGSLSVRDGDYEWITRELLAIAEDSAGGRLVSILEGGYDLEALAASARAHVAGLVAVS